MFSNMYHAFEAVFLLITIVTSFVDRIVTQNFFQLIQKAAIGLAISNSGAFRTIHKTFQHHVELVIIIKPDIVFTPITDIKSAKKEVSFIVFVLDKAIYSSVNDPSVAFIVVGVILCESKSLCILIPVKFGVNPLIPLTLEPFF